MCALKAQLFCFLIRSRYVTDFSSIEVLGVVVWISRWPAARRSGDVAPIDLSVIWPCERPASFFVNQLAIELLQAYQGQG